MRAPGPGIKVLRREFESRMNRSMAGKIRFSPSKGWDQVRAWLAQHMNVFVAIAGVFFLLPLLVLEFVGPAFVAPVIDPETTDPQIALNAMVAAFQPLIPWLIALILVQLVGRLAIMAIAAARSGIGVSEAIGIGFSRFGWLILVNIVLGIGFALLVLLLSLVAAALAMVIPALAVIFALIAFVGFAYIGIRLGLISALIVTEDLQSPFALIVRSWQLTGGNAGAIFLFYLLVSIVYLIIVMVTGLIFGLIGLALGSTGAAIAAVLSGIVAATGTTIFSLMPVAVWRQVADAQTTPEIFS